MPSECEQDSHYCSTCGSCGELGCCQYDCENCGGQSSHPDYKLCRMQPIGGILRFYYREVEDQEEEED